MNTKNRMTEKEQETSHVRAGLIRACREAVQSGKRTHNYCVIDDNIYYFDSGGPGFISISFPSGNNNCVGIL